MPGWIKIERGGGDRPAGRDGGRRAAREPEPGATRTVNLGPLLVVAMLVAALAGGLWYARGRSAAPAAGDTVATVDGDPITARDVDIEFLLQRAIRSAMGMELVDDPEAVRAFRRDVLDQLVDQRLIVHAAAANGTIIDDATLDARLPTIGQSFQIQTEVLLQHATSEGITEPEFREWARRQLTIGQYLATPDAIERGQEIMTERGLPVGSLGGAPVQSSDVASQLQRAAEIVFFFGGQDGARTVRVDEPAPDFTLAAPDGGGVKLSEFRGTPVMLNFWATWCGPCRIEMPLFVHTYGQHAGDLVVLAVDVQEDAETVLPFVDSFGMTFPVALDRDGQVSTLYRVRGLPTTFFIDADGIVRQAHRGTIRSSTQLNELLDTILPAAAGG